MTPESFASLIIVLFKIIVIVVSIFRMPKRTIFTFIFFMLNWDRIKPYDEGITQLQTYITYSVTMLFIFWIFTKEGILAFLVGFGLGSGAIADWLRRRIL
ncbi:hypothetical protein [Shewanella sp. 6_MG-2023]|uniref:hypothetical protein n=1 Tax=Shewanella sp. 6_MG-2023 TaxID=3062660 RepID=UPI0026E470F5|nr:hypothetical protein [Shewanella sp. 6_MG-2023]MDO6621081.1 hypothetical protein [Shewanella sp. 6_MG-2023]